MIELYDLTAEDDTLAWNTHKIRSHRAASTTPSRWIALGLAAVSALGAITAGIVGATLHSVQSETPVFAEVAPFSAGVPVLLVQPSRTQKINSVITFALSQRGDGYKFGAAGPSKWDCSGLIMKSFAKAGIKLPHYTGSIIKHGKHVSRKNLQSGDIIFPQRGHVAIYLGNNQMITASSGHHKVMVQTVYGFYAARRVL